MELGAWDTVCMQCLWSSLLSTFISPRSREPHERLCFLPLLQNSIHSPCQGFIVQAVCSPCFLLWGWSHLHYLPFASVVHTCHLDYSTGSKQGSCFMTRCYWEQLFELQVTEGRPSCYGCGKPLSFFSQVNAVLAKRLLFPQILEGLQEWLGGLC